MLSKDLSNNSPSGSISITTKASPIIKTKTQSNPGLSFFCQPIVSLSKPTKTKATQPMVVSRINLPISRPKEEEIPINKVSPVKTSGIGTFMLRGLLFPQKALDEAKVHRRVKEKECCNQTRTKDVTDWRLGNRKELTVDFKPNTGNCCKRTDEYYHWLAKETSCVRTITSRFELLLTVV